MQSHTSNRDLGLLLATSRGALTENFEGLAEAWLPSRRVLERRMATVVGTQANLRLAADERNFIDVANSAFS